MGSSPNIFWAGFEQREKQSETGDCPRQWPRVQNHLLLQTQEEQESFQLLHLPLLNGHSGKALEGRHRWEIPCKMFFWYCKSKSQTNKNPGKKKSKVTIFYKEWPSWGKEFELSNWFDWLHSRRGILDVFPRNPDSQAQAEQSYQVTANVRQIGVK
jgi:hypothetical protein